MKTSTWIAVYNITNHTVLHLFQIHLISTIKYEWKFEFQKPMENCSVDPKRECHYVFLQTTRAELAARVGTRSGASIYICLFLLPLDLDYRFICSCFRLDSMQRGHPQLSFVLTCETLKNESGASTESGPAYSELVIWRGGGLLGHLYINNRYI